MRFKTLPIFTLASYRMCLNFSIRVTPKINIITVGFKAAAFAKKLQEKENTVGDLTEAEKKLQDEYKALGM